MIKDELRNGARFIYSIPFTKKIRGTQRSLGTWASGSGEAILPQRLVVSSIEFDDLHPEFEVLDWRGQSYFCDFAYITRYVKLLIEIKGFGPHVRDMDRNKYCNELNRETFLSAMGFQVISFAYDDVASRPEICMTLLRMLHSLCTKGVLSPVTGPEGNYVVKYELQPNAMNRL